MTIIARAFGFPVEDFSKRP